MRKPLAIVALAALSISAAAPAQLPGLGGGGGGLLGGVLPNVGSAGIGNVTGLLGYCLKNKLLGKANAKSVLGTLAGREDVAGSDEYSDGQEGILHADDATFSLDSLKGKVKGKVCDMVLNRAQSFL
jgi:hypothetical protein